MIKCPHCGEDLEQVTIWASVQTASLLYYKEDGKYYEVPFDESPDAIDEEFVCAKCGYKLPDEIASKVSELMG